MKRKLSITDAMTGLILGSVVFLNAQAFAEESIGEFSLDTIVVSATRTEKSILQTPASVTVITAKEIKDSGAVFVDDVLKRAPGVQVSRSSGIGTSKPVVNMRGFKNNYDTCVLVDGQPMVNAYAGAVNWNDIPVESIEKIEILRGPASAIYGANAASGVISITTKKTKGMHGYTSLGYGTNHTWVKKINVGDKVKKFGYDLYYTGTNSHTWGYEAYKSLTKSKTEGTVSDKNFDIRPNTKGNGKVVRIGIKGDKIWDEDNYSGKFTWDFDENKTLALSIFRDKSTYSYDYNSHENWIGTPGTYFVDKFNNFTFADYDFSGSSGTVDERIYTLYYNDKQNGWKVNLGLTDNRSWSGGAYDTVKKVSDLSVYNSKRYTFGLNKELRFSEKDVAVVGLQLNYDKMDKINLVQPSFTKINSAGNGKSTTYALYIQDEHRFDDKLSLIGSLRYDYWNVKDGYVLDPNGYSISPESKSDSALSPKIALNYQFDDSQSAYVSWGKAFASPTLYKMFSGSTNSDLNSMKIVKPNPALEPQLTTTWETGWKKNIDNKTIVEAALFYNKIKNISYQAIVGTEKIDGKDYNVQQEIAGDEGENKGIELSVKHKFDDKLTAFSNVTFQNPILTKTSNKKQLNKLVTQFSKRLFNIGLNYTDGKLVADLSGNYYSKKFGQGDNSDIMTNVPGSYDPVFLMTLNTSYRFDKNSSVNLLINNLLDREYHNYNNMQGRNFLLTYTYNF